MRLNKSYNGKSDPINDLSDTYHSKYFLSSKVSIPSMLTAASYNKMCQLITNK